MNIDPRLVALLRVEASWNADQALIWVATRHIPLVAAASRHHRERRLTWLRVREAAIDKTDCDNAQAWLKSALDTGELDVRDGLSLLSKHWIQEADWWVLYPSGAAILAHHSIDELQFDDTLIPKLKADGLPLKKQSSARSLRFEAREVVTRFQASGANSEISHEETVANNVQAGPFARSVRVIVASILKAWSDAGADPAKKPTSDEIFTAVRVERPSESRQSIRSAFATERQEYPEVEWSKTGPRRRD